MNARDIDLATIKAWPAAITEEHHGWYYLAAGGVTGRVNAVWPIDWRGGDVNAAIAHAEAWYAARGLPPRFKLTDDAYAPADLPALLAQRGYQSVMPTLIMTAKLGAGVGAYDGVTLSPTVTQAFDDVLSESTANADDLEERRSIARRVPAPAAFALRERNGRTLAVGASAVVGTLGGIFLMRTAPKARRQGHALHILRALLDWAARQGAREAFLQVDADNTPAIALYQREGFTALTTYRFWRKP